MYSILTCDDEQIAVDSLQFIISKNFEGQVNLFSALSGSEALQIVSREKIDIIFMDINMPGMTGLETISCIKNLKPETVIIVLSAFDKFQYAQEAMNLGAFKYITKPASRNIVIQTVRNAMNLVDERARKDSSGEELLKKLSVISPIVESDFIYSCIFNTEKNSDLSAYLNYFNINLRNYFFACVEIPRIARKNKKELYLRVREIAGEKSGCFVGSFMANRLPIFFYDGGNSENFQDAAREIHRLLSMNLGQGIRMGVGRVSSLLDEISDCYNDAIAALNSTGEKESLVFSHSLSRTEDSSKRISEAAERIFNRLKMGDAAGASVLFGIYLDELKNSGMEDDRMKSKIFELLVNARNIAAKENPAHENPQLDDTFGFLSRTSEDEAIRKFVQSRLAEFAQEISSGKEKKENPSVKKAVEFIEKNLSENFSLENVAEAAGISEFHLSKLFKEETGETFINFVTDMRLEKSKQLLCGSELSVKEISAQVGYNDQNYFSRLFKNKFGISPTDFRAMGGSKK